MRFHSQSSTNALQRLERLTASLSTGTPSRLATAQSVNAIDNILSDLRRQIVNDGLGVSVGSEEELVFRTVRMIIDAQLGDLEKAIHSILAVDLPPSAKPDMWRGFLKALPLAKAELWRVTRIWLPYRRGEPTMRDPSHAAAYKLALRSAFEELDKMDDIPDVDRVLYRGIAAARWPDVVSACEQILVAMHVRVDVDAGRRIWAARSRWTQAVGGGMSAEPMTAGPIRPVLCDRTKVAGQGDALGCTEHNPSAAFVRKRLRLQHELRALKEAHEQGLALDMAHAAKRSEAAARELAAHLRSLLAHKACMETRGGGRAVIERKAQLKARVQGALYECRALRESAADLFEACLRRETPDPSAAWPNGRSPAESYLWLRRSLEGYATMIDRSLTAPDE